MAPVAGQPIRVLCIDDVPDVAAVLQMVLEAEPGIVCVGCLHSAADLVVEVQRAGAQVVVLDGSMPGKPPMEAMRELAEQLPQVATIIYSGYDDAKFIEGAIDAGAWGCVSKSDSPEILVEAVRTVASGETYFPNMSGTRPVKKS